MTTSKFDPYYYFLGIPPKDQPPDYYRLLGLERFESNLQVIEMAADRHMAHLQRHESGDHAERVARLLGEISRARLCLLNPRKKAAYDTQLGAQRESDRREKPGAVTRVEPVKDLQNWLDEELAGLVTPNLPSKQPRPDGTSPFAQTHGGVTASWLQQAKDSLEAEERASSQFSQLVKLGLILAIAAIAAVLSVWFVVLGGTSFVLVMAFAALFAFVASVRLALAQGNFQAWYLAGVCLLVSIVSFFLTHPSVMGIMLAISSLVALAAVVLSVLGMIEIAGNKRLVTGWVEAAATLAALVVLYIPLLMVAVHSVREAVSKSHEAPSGSSAVESKPRHGIVYQRNKRRKPSSSSAGESKVP